METFRLVKGMHLHLVGIGGVGMAALAVLLKREGCRVSGCDLTDSPRMAWLRTQGVEVAVGHDPAHVAGVDCVVATSAMAANHPEILAAGSFRRRGEVLAEIVGRRSSIAVCGTHGKTTTTTYIVRLLRALGEDVAWAVGGETGGFPVAGGGDGVLVVEADESDGTLALYHPELLVVTNCEYDHPDHFADFAAYRACFDRARANARAVIEGEQLGEKPLECCRGEPWYAALAPHNRRNAAIAAAVALGRGHAFKDIVRHLPAIAAELPDRRFEPLSPGVWTDYAHHPTEMACAIAMARAQVRGDGRLRVLFQPHRYSRTAALRKSFPAAFAMADEVVILPTYAAFESPVAGGTAADLYACCRASEREGGGPRYLLAQSAAEAWRHARLEQRPGDVLLLLGAGDIIALAPLARAGLPPAGGVRRSLAGFSFFRTGGCTVGGGARHRCGAGSNTWISDLTTDEEYVCGEDPAAAPGATLGIPWMAGIPGTIGGWTKMNAGAFGHSFAEALAEVNVDGEWRAASKCGFGYRRSEIAGEVRDVRLRSDYPGKDDSPGEYLSRRRRFPARCCGSVFRNPDGDTAGRLLEAAGCKGMRVGGAEVWQEHANVVFAGEGARSSDILALVSIMRQRVRAAFGVELAPEIAGLAQ